MTSRRGQTAAEAFLTRRKLRSSVVSTASQPGHSLTRLLVTFVAESAITLVALIGVIRLAQLAIHWLELFDEDDED
jgi:hypothetical protein